ncbi:hypothetical protein [Halocatena halophila]|uniref:hypothetical protein n=1 Tax=Halocatena halophila TaxID=2814576 RepID=UPI002ED51BBA
MDLTIFEVDIDEPTVNAPFSGDKVVRQPTDTPVEHSRPRRLRGMLVGLVSVVTVGVGVFLWRRRQNGEPAPTGNSPSPELATEKSTDRGGLRSLIGLAFLCSLSVLVGLDETDADTSRAGWQWWR